jgi:hypothetical protein
MLQERYCCAVAKGLRSGILRTFLRSHHNESNVYSFVKTSLKHHL